MEERADIFNNQQIRGGVIFYALYLFICLLIKFTDWFNTYGRLFWMEVLLAVVTFLFAFNLRKQLKPVLSLKRIHRLPALFIAAVAVFFFVITQCLIVLLHIKVRNAGVEYYSGLTSIIPPFWVMTFSVALMPALFEELAFRGVLYEYFSAAADENRVVFITAVIFAAMHLNSVALLWLFPLGILLGNLRKKHHTVWYGVIFHFTFNFLICLQEKWHHYLPLPFSSYR